MMPKNNNGNKLINYQINIELLLKARHLIKIKGYFLS